LDAPFAAGVGTATTGAASGDFSERFGFLVCAFVEVRESDFEVAFESLTVTEMWLERFKIRNPRP
jgi:hypothetical protein